MKIDLTKVSAEDLAAVIGRSDWERAMAACGQCELPIDLWQLTLADFGKVIAGKTPDKIAALFHVEQSSQEYLQTENAVQSFFESYINMLSKFTVKQSTEEIQAAVGLPTFVNNEGLLVFARGYFGLHSFSDAEQVTLADVYLAKKDAYISAMYQKNYNQLQSLKHQTKKR